MDPNKNIVSPPIDPAAQPANSGLNKEQELSSTLVETVQNENAEFAPPKEVSPYVKVISDKPEIPTDVANIGVTHSPAEKPVIPAKPAVDSSIPLSDDQINEGIKQPVSSSYRWFAELCLKKLKKQLQLIHFHMKKIHGRYVRVPD